MHEALSQTRRCPNKPLEVGDLLYSLSCASPEHSAACQLSQPTTQRPQCPVTTALLGVSLLIVAASCSRRILLVPMQVVTKQAQWELLVVLEFVLMNLLLQGKLERELAAHHLLCNLSVCMVSWCSRCRVGCP